MSDIKVTHMGRSGYVEYEGKRYPIEMFAGGHFSIGFPAGHRHSRLQEHLDALKEFASSRQPEWFVENRSKKYQ